jgi:hypothetical protein
MAYGMHQHISTSHLMSLHVGYSVQYYSYQCLSSSRPFLVVKIKDNEESESDSILFAPTR